MDVAHPAIAPPSPSPHARWRIRLTYWWRHRRLPDLDDPRTFTELVQARKLSGHDRTMVAMADKVVAKTRVAAQLGPGWTIPTLWHGTVLPETAPWPRPFVVKARHGCNQNIFVFEDRADWPAIRATAAGWMRRRYGGWLDESLYRDLPRGLLVEPFMGTPPVLPVDYKCYVFGGRVEAVQVHLARGGEHRWLMFDRSWRRLSLGKPEADPRPPASLPTMIAAAETLAAGRDFCRVDLYEIDGKPLFGEMTFYPGSGLDRFEPVALDAMLGEHWLRARGARRGSGSRVGQAVELIGA